MLKIPLQQQQRSQGQIFLRLLKAVRLLRVSLVIFRSLTLSFLTRTVGEEKASEKEFDTAANELTSKMGQIDEFYHGNWGYMICYAAAGTLVKFYGISKLVGINSYYIVCVD